MDTTIMISTFSNACATHCMDIVTAGLITLATIAVMVLVTVYALAGICKRLR